MRKVSLLRILLELIVIAGYLVIGVTLVTFLMQHESISQFFIGLFFIAIGVIQITEFFTLRIATKLKSAPNVVVAVLLIALGFILVFLNFEPEALCLILAIACLSFGIVRIITAVLNLLRQPLLNAVRIILNIIMIVMCIFLIAKRNDVLIPFTLFLGIALLVEAGVLLIEFFIRRYQNN